MYIRHSDHGLDGDGETQGDGELSFRLFFLPTEIGSDLASFLEVDLGT